MADSLQTYFDECPSMLFVAEPDGKLRHHSRALETRFGHRFSTGASLFALIDAAEHASLAAFLRERAANDATASCVLAVIDADGRTIPVRCVARAGSNGTINGELELAQATTDAEQMARIEHALLHAIASSLDIVVWVVDKNGTFVIQDGKALALANMKPGQLLGQNVFELFPAESATTIRKALAGTPNQHRFEGFEQHWENWYVPLINDVGEVDYCAGLSLNVTASVTNERSLEQQLQTIKRQQQSIHELSAPVINVWDRVLTVPLIGVMDAARTDELTSRLLAEVHRVHARFAILDLTGVETIDTAIAGHLLRLLGSLRLLGVEGLVTGVRPQVAHTMVAVGIDFDNVVTLRTVREGLRYCMQALYCADKNAEP